MIFAIDRVQKRACNNSYLITEFMTVSSINNLFFMAKNGRLNNASQVTELLQEIDKKKFEFLFNLNIDTDIILYDDNRQCAVLLSKRIQPYSWTIRAYSIKELSEYFNRINGENTNYSKRLGSAKDDNGDNYTNNIIKQLNGLLDYKDDAGLELTKELLNGNPTKGFDLDLFQYISSTNEFVFFEFLKRESTYTTNITAHPMRYCWTGNYRDNKQKFISLWEVKQYFGGRLFLINYSDDISELISISEIVELDPELGIREEYKYVMTYSQFIEWLNIMNNYNSTNRNYLNGFKRAHYDSEFFNNWNINKSKYGKLEDFK